MDRLSWTHNLKTVKLQRNYALCLNIFLSLVVIVCLGIVYKNSNLQTIVVVPAHLKSAVTISNETVDEAYLIQWTEFIATLKLNVTPDLMLASHRNLLAYVAPAYYGAFKQHVLLEQTQIKKDEISMVFYPKTTTVLQHDLFKTQISGILKLYIGEVLHQSVQVIYELQFEMHNGRLLLSHFKEVGRA
jgi:conjugal transfer pilus assembly protein TraE